MSARANGWIFAVAGACFVLGVTLSHRVEPGVRVQTVMLAGDTPALRFLPAEAGPHPVALLAHGVTASKETLFRFGEALATAGFSCYAVDLPGHGQSRRLFGRGDNAITLAGVARELGSVDVFIGHSMGAGAGAGAVCNGGLSPRLFIAVGALPDLGPGGPPLLLLAGEFEEAVPVAWLKARTDARLGLFPWCDHALEPYDPRLVNAAVAAACATVGKTPPKPPTRWCCRLAGMVLGIFGALGVAFCLPEFSARWARLRGPVVAAIAIVAVVLTTSTWLGAAPVPRRVPTQILVMACCWLGLIGAGKLGIPRWSFSALAAGVALSCAVMGASLLALFVCIGAVGLFEAAMLGWLAARHGSQRDADLAMAVLVGYAVGQWLPRLF